MKVLIACESSAVVRDQFRALGHDAWSCDLLPCERSPQYHIQADVLTILDAGWELMIAHPPCDYLSNSGVQWLMRTPSNPSPGVLYGSDRWKALFLAANFFRQLLNAPIPRKAIENPIPHHYAIELIRRTYDQTFQPSDFGEPYRKRTCLWLENLPPLSPTTMIPAHDCIQEVWLEGPGQDRKANRSRFYEGPAEQMAKQWGGDIRRRKRA